MKSLSALLALTALAATSALAQMSQPMVDDNTTKISDHVWAIMCPSPELDRPDYIDFSMS
jgi:phenylpropionate dioxygenase-like ring-hydroxylating dioxygenase large terminal subunit